MAVRAFGAALLFLVLPSDGLPGFAGAGHTLMELMNKVKDLKDHQNQRPNMQPLLNALGPAAGIAQDLQGVHDLKGLQGFAQKGLRGMHQGALPPGMQGLAQGMQGMQGLQGFAQGMQGMQGMQGTQGQGPPMDLVMNMEKVAADILTECRDVPKLLVEAFRKTECSANLTDSVQTFSLMLVAMTQDIRKVTTSHQRGQLPQDVAKVILGKSSTVFKEKLHTLFDNYCGNAACIKAEEVLLKHYSTCYSNAMCNAMSQTVPSVLCRPMVSGLMSTSVRSETLMMCQQESGRTTYCPEMLLDLATKHFSCWAELQSPVKGCSPQCTQVWRELRASYPECTDSYAASLVRSQSLAGSVLSLLGQGSTAAPQRSVDEICSDINVQFVIQDDSQQQEAYNFNVPVPMPFNI